jgi:hypothetical protein
MATKANITIPADLLAQAERIAQAEGKSPDDFTAEAVKKEIARRLISQLRQEAKSSGMTEDQEIDLAVKAVHDYRRGL